MMQGMGGQGGGWQRWRGDRAALLLRRPSLAFIFLIAVIDCLPTDRYLTGRL